MAEVEQFKAIASFQFIGEAEVRRMAQAMQEVGLLSEQAAARAIGAASAMGQGLLSAVQAQRTFVEALGLSAGAASQLFSQMEQLSRGQAPTQGLRDTVALVDKLEGSVRRLAQAGSTLPAGIGEKIRAEFGALFTQGAGMLASAPIKTRISTQPLPSGGQALQTAAGTFVLSPLGGRGAGYGVNLPGPTQQQRAAAGEYDRVFRTKADAVSAVRDVLAAFGATPARSAGQPQLPPGIGLPPPAPYESPAQARINARLERLLAAQAEVQRQGSSLAPIVAGPVPARTDPLAVIDALTASMRALDFEIRNLTNATQAMRARALRERLSAGPLALGPGTWRPTEGFPGPIGRAQTFMQAQRQVQQILGAAAAGTPALPPGVAEQERASRRRAEQFMANARQQMYVQQAAAFNATPRYRQLPPGPLTGNLPAAFGQAQQWAQFFRNLGTAPPPFNVTGVGGAGGFRYGATYGPGVGTAGGYGPYTPGPGGYRYSQRPPYVPGAAAAPYGPTVIPGQATPAGGGGGGPTIIPPWKPPGGGGGFFDNFARGFRGNPDRTIAEQLGQTARFAVYYGAAYKILFGITQTLQTGLDEAIKFQQGMAELSIATSRSAQANQDLARHLGDQAAAVGQSPSLGLEVGARAIGLYDLHDAGQAVQDAAMRRANTAVQQLQFTTGRKPEQLQLDVGAISQAFDFGYQSINQIADLDAYFTKRFGIRTGQTLETVAQVGSLGAQAGFGAEEVFAIAGKLQSRTGQTPAAVAGLLSQIFSRSGEGSLQSQFQQLGIDVTAPFRDQLQALSVEYQTMSAGERQRLTSSFGRGRSQGAAAILLEDFSEITSGADDARREAGGAAEQQFKVRMDNVGGQLAELVGQFKLFGIELANSGILAAFGASVVALREFLEAVTNVLRVWNEIPGAVRNAVLGLGTLALAAKLGGASLVRGAVARGGLMVIPGTVSASGRTTFVNSATGATAFGGAVGGGVRGAAASARAAGGLAGAGGVVNMLGGPVVLGAIAALGTIAIAKGTYEKLQAASQQATDALLSIASIDPKDPAALASAAQTLDDAAKKQRDLPLTSDILSAFGLPFQDRANARADIMEKNAIAIREQQTLRERLQERQTEMRRASTSPFGDFSTQAIADGFDSLTAQGLTAAQRLDLFSAAIANVGMTAEQALQQSYDPQEFAGRFATAAPQRFLANLPERVFLGGSTDDGKPTYWRGETLREQYKMPDEGALRTKLADAAAAMGIKSEAVTPEQQEALTDILLRELINEETLPTSNPRLRGMDEAALAEFREQQKKWILDWYKNEAADALAAVDPNRVFTPEEATAQLNILAPQAEAQLAEVPRGNAKARIKALEANLAGAQKLADETKGVSGQVQGRIANAQADLAEGMVEDLQRQADAAARKGDTGEVERLERAMLDAAINHPNAELLGELINKQGEAAVKYARQQITALQKSLLKANKNAPAIKNLQKEYENKVKAIQDSPEDNPLADLGRGVMLPGQKPTGASIDVDPRLAEAKSEYEKAVQEALKGLNEFVNTLFEGLFAALSGGSSGAKGPTAAQIAAAKQAALVAPGDTIGAAKAAIAVAQADMDAIKRSEDPVGYWRAYRALQDAKFALAAAEIDGAKIANDNRAAFTGGDLGNARSQLQNAELELTKYAKGTQEYNRALGAYFQAQLAFAEAARQARSEQRTLSLDITDPVAEAREQARVSREALRYTRRRARQADSPGGAAITEDERAEINVRVNQARRDRLNAQGQAWQQQFSDMQTAEQLGRISHTAWIQYLQNESNRLHARHNKSRQQIDQMNQVDQALKAAQEAMNAQFNLGDIKLPTPYQVRRAIGGYDAARTQAVSQTITVNVNGNDLAAMRRELEQILGISTTKSTYDRKA